MILKLMIFLMSLVCWVQAEEPAANPPMVEAVQRGEAFAARGMLNQAIAQFERAVELGAGSPQVLNQLAGLYLATDQPQKSIVILKRSLAEKPGQLALYSRLGEVFLALGQLDSAIYYVEEARTLAPQTSTIYSSLGFLYLQKGQLQQAREFLQKSHELDEDNPEALRFLGFYYTQVDSLDQAIDYYTRMTERVPQDVEAHNNIAFLYSQKGQYPEALAYYKKAKDLAADPRFAHAINMNMEAIRAIMDGKMRARYILVKSAVEARDIIQRLEKGADFGDLAAQFSLAPNAVDGGDAGFFGAGELMPEFEGAVLQLQVGQYSQPVNVQQGYMVIQRLN